MIVAGPSVSHRGPQPSPRRGRPRVDPIGAVVAVRIDQAFDKASQSCMVAVSIGFLPVVMLAVRLAMTARLRPGVAVPEVAMLVTVRGKWGC